MDLIYELIDTLEEEDFKDFRYFLNRYRNRADRKDLELFELLISQQNPERDFLLFRLYPEDKNIEAYHATRKRLMRQLTEYVLLKKRGTNTSEGYIENLILLSRYLFDMNREEAGWGVLKQAAELARKSEMFGLLNYIYTMQVEHSASEFADDLQKILAEKLKYQELALEDDKANTANHLIRYELSKSLTTGKEADIRRITKRVLREYGLTKAIATRPKLVYNIISIVRSAVLAGKDFYYFEPFIIERYQELEKKKSFNKYNHYYKVSLLYMIAHVLYRNKKFSEAEQYLDVLYKSLQEHNKSQFTQFYPRYTLLLAAVYNYSGRNSQATELLEKLLASKKVKMDKARTLDTYLNLSTYYFQQEEYNKSIRIFRNVQHSDKWLTKVMGFEWVLKKNIIECINQFELGNSDIAEQRLNSIERNYYEIFQRPMYQRVKTFLSLVKKLNNDPSVASTKDFILLVESSFKFIDIEKEDIQAMTFYGWLKAKMQKRKYYKVLLELVNG